MKNFPAWVPPLSVSLLLHAAVILIYINNTKLQLPNRIQTNVLTVDMQQSTSVSQPKLLQTKPKPVEKEITKPEPVVTETSEKIATETPAPPSEPTTSSEIPATAINNQPVIQPLSKLTKLPGFINKIDPQYPAAEQRSNTQAFVLAEVTLDASGKVSNIQILRSAGKYFDQAVIEAIENSSFTPGYIEKDAVAVKVQIPFRFKLK